MLALVIRLKKQHGIEPDECRVSLPQFIDFKGRRLSRTPEFRGITLHAFKDCKVAWIDWIVLLQVRDENPLVCLLIRELGFHRPHEITGLPQVLIQQEKPLAIVSIDNISLNKVVLVETDKENVFMVAEMGHFI